MLYLYQKHNHQIARIAVTFFQLHKSRLNLLQCIQNQYMHLYKLTICFCSFEWVYHIIDVLEQSESLHLVFQSNSSRRFGPPLCHERDVEITLHSSINVFNFSCYVKITTFLLDHVNLLQNQVI